MSTPDNPKEIEAAIVMLGDFHPAAFNQHWLIANEIFDEAEIQNEQTVVVRAELNEIHTTWCKFLVTNNRLQFLTPQDSMIGRLADTVKLLASRVPLSVKAVGLNFESHFQFLDAASWHKVGDCFAPKDGWQQIVGKRGGLLQMTMEFPREDGFKGYLRIQSGTSIKHTPGIQFHLNDHHVIPEDGSVEDNLKKIIDRFEESISTSRQICVAALKYAAEKQNV